MVHVIIILHFIAFALGIGLLVYGYTEYKRTKRQFLKEVLIGGMLLTTIFFVDTLRIYTGKIIQSVFLLYAIYSLLAILSIYTLYFLLSRSRKIERGQFQRLGRRPVVIVSLMIICLVLLGLSAVVSWLRVMPYLLCVYGLAILLSIELIRTKDFEKTDSVESVTKQRADELVMALLTPRENEILSYLLKGMSNNEIGEALFISSHTVKNHVSNIYKKLEVKNKVELINKVNAESVENSED